MDTPTLREVHDLVKSRSFGPVAARTLINYSAYVAGTDPSVHIHPHVHIMAGGAGRAPDEHFRDKLDFKNEPDDERAMQSMFRSLEEGAGGVSAAMNCRAGEAVVNFFHMSAVRRVALHSRPRAAGVPEMTLRSATSAMGTRSGTMYMNLDTSFVTLVFTIYAGCLVLVTGLPAGVTPWGRNHPPENMDLVVYSGQDYPFPAEG